MDINKVELSVVVPAFNEEQVIDSSLKKIRSVLDSENIKYEIIVIDDGSTDLTKSKLLEVQKTWENLKLLFFVKNRGHMAAITAGLNESKGNWVLTIDADLQDPAEVIPIMYRKANDENVDVVYGVRKDRTSDTFLKRVTAAIYYKLINKITESEVPAHAADCRLMSRRVVDLVNSLPEKNKIYRLLIPWLGFPSTTVEYSRQSRGAGKSHYKLRHMISLAWNSVTSFSILPLRLAIYTGFVGVIGSVALIIYVITGYLANQTIPGWSSLTILILFFGSIQLIFFGILGEYISKIFIQLQNRPTYNLDR